MLRHFLTLLLICLASVADADTTNETTVVETSVQTNLMDQTLIPFAATEPTARVQYKVSYRFMGIEWKYLANAMVQVTEGRWSGIPGSGPIPAYLFEMTLDSAAKETPQKRARVSIHNRMAAVLTAPKLQSILFIKDFDQHLNPVFGRTQDARTFESYDLQTGKLEYYRKDYLTGVILTNMTGVEKLEEQSRNVFRALDIMAKTYFIQCTNTDATTNMPIHVNIEGKVAKFKLVMDRRDSPVDFNGAEVASLRVRTQPDRSSEVKPKDCELWSIPFSEAATKLNDETLLRIASRAPLDCMTPLAVDYEMTLGYIRGSMVSLTATNRAAGTEPERNNAPSQTRP